MNINHLSASEIKMLTTELRQGKQINWPTIGLLLLSAEHNRSWESDSNSFTAWVRKLSRDLKKQESTFWRYLAAVKSYLKLRDCFINLGIDCPEVIDLHEKISPENVELLEKLNRVMPEDEFLRYGKRVIENEIKRRELRDLWEIYRPLLQGKTARGLDVVPKIDVADKNQFNSQIEAAALTNLIDRGPEWLNKIDIDIYKTYRDIKMPIKKSGRTFTFKPDLLLLTGTRKDCNFQFHVIECLSPLVNIESIETLIEVSKKVNYVWIIYHTDSNEHERSLLPDRFGQLALSTNAQIKVSKMAKFVEIDQTFLLKQIVQKSI